MNFDEFVDFCARKGAPGGKAGVVERIKAALYDRMCNEWGVTDTMFNPNPKLLAIWRKFMSSEGKVFRCPICDVALFYVSEGPFPYDVKVLAACPVCGATSLEPK